MAIEHKKQSASGVIQTTDWDGSAHKFSGGTDGQVPISAANAEGHVFGYAKNLAFAASDVEIPINTWTLKITGTPGAERFSFMVNRNGTMVEIFSYQE